MPRRKLQQILDDLQQEIHTGELSETDRDSLRALIGNVKDVVDEDVDSDDESIIEALRDTTVQFESTHPRLTRALSTISDLLHSIGIN